MSVAAAVLAAGGGTRFEGPTHKLLAPLRDKPVVQWAIESALAAGFDTVYVAHGAVDLSEVVPGGVTLVEVPDWHDGQARSLAAVVARAEADRHDAIVVGLGDQPLVGPAAWRTVGAGRGQIVTASFDGDRRPPVKLEAAVWPLLDGVGDEGARGLMRSRPDLVREVRCIGNPFDIDRLEDLATWSSPTPSPSTGLSPRPGGF
ncbi:MAG: nucleotidyltransferase family protein [Acidimicrobiales bacterium]